MPRLREVKQWFSMEGVRKHARRVLSCIIFFGAFSIQVKDVGGVMDEWRGEILLVGGEQCCNTKCVRDVDTSTGGHYIYAAVQSE